MTTTTHPQDEGVKFGTWDDPVANLLYVDSTPKWLEALGVDTTRITVDLGGANGLLRAHFPRLVTVDSDPSKEPDVVADARTWDPAPMLSARPVQAVLRYVTHYMDDRDVLQTLTTVARYADTVHLVQFVNDDKDAKYANSRHEGPRWFRTTAEHALLVRQAHPLWAVMGAWSSPEYTVAPGFYEKRLGPGEYTPHTERIVALTLRKDPRA